MVTLNPYRQTCPYDVGDTLITENPLHPSKRWPGTAWLKEEGVFLLGASSTYPVGSTGGEKTVTLQIQNIPRVDVQTAVSTVQAGGANDPSFASVATEWRWDGKTFLRTGRLPDYGDENGNSVGHNNMPPYKAKYIWTRTA